MELERIINEMKTSPGIVIILLLQMSSSNYHEIIMKSILSIINIPILDIFWRIKFFLRGTFFLEKKMRKLEHRLVYIMHTEKNRKIMKKNSLWERCICIYIYSIVGPITYRN